MSPDSTETRSHQVELTIEAPVESVWKALTDADELANWFPLSAEVKPGKGGSIRLSWGEEMTGECPIEVWEPNKHLQTGWSSMVDQETNLVVDFTLEGRGGRTVLRMVHSGFRKSQEWDQEYDSTHRGWSYELRSLRHYLERHRGKTRRIALARAPINMPNEKAWERLMSPQGILKEGSLGSPSEGDRYKITTASGDPLEGVVLMMKHPTDFAGTVENMDDSLLRIMFEECFGHPEAQMWLATWGMPEAQVREIEKRWTDLLITLY